MKSLLTPFDPSKPFTAEFGSIGDIGSWFNHGFVVGRYKKLKKRDSYESVLLSGNTGSGKTSRYLLKQILSLKNCSLLVNDPQFELWKYGSGYLKRHFKNIYSINFSNSAVSAGYSPFSRIRKPNDVHKLASLLISNTLHQSGDIFWSLASINLTQVLIRILLYQPTQFHNLANLIRMLHFFSVEPGRTDAWVAETKDEKLIIDYKGIVATPEKTLQNVVASVKAALQVFDDPEIAKTTAYDTIDFEKMRTEPTAIFLHNTLGDQKYINVLNSILFDQFYAFALEKLPQKDDLSIYVLLEECASLYIPMLAQATATCRKAFVGNYLAVQSHSQLKSFYKDQSETIKSNCRTKIWLSGQTSIEELREIETLSGKRIYIDDKGSEKVVPLISMDAIRTMPKNRSLILSSNFPLILAKSSPYYRSLIFRRRAAIPPAELECHIPDTPIPMIK
ncbi:type IV secretory system conjugative DNA transfer family protein [Mucilaginibacter sp. HD30]